MYKRSTTFAARVVAAQISAKRMRDLNAAQRVAVETLTGPLLVLAGAGTGKTRVVTYRIANLIRHGIQPDRILAVTFTRKAAGEMQERTMALARRRRRGGPRPEISTFHSLCLKVLRRHCRVFGYPENFVVANRGEQESQARAALRQVRASDAALRPGDLLAIIGQWKTAGLLPDTAAAQADTDRLHLAAAAYRHYQRNLQSCATLDFDDLLLVTESLFRRHSKVRRAEAARFDHLLIDEYQDTNGSQYRIVKALAEGHRNLCVVGDDDQSIYGWRGAEVTHILSFCQDWPEATVVRLEDNYRSTAPILDYSNQLIAHNRLRHGKVLRAASGQGPPPRILQYPDENLEAQGVVNDIHQRLVARSARPRDFAILFRTNDQTRPFEQELRRLNLPYVLIGGMSFFDRREVRDILAYLKMLVNPHDDPSLLRILNTPPRGIGRATVDRLRAAAVDANSSVWSLIQEQADNDALADAASKTVRQSLDGFRHMIGKLTSQAESQTLSKLTQAVIDAVDYRAEIDRLYADAEQRLQRRAALDEFVSMASSFQRTNHRAGLKELLDYVAVGELEDTDDKESQLERDSIALMTIHSAKGLEFPQVYLVGLEEGILPHKHAVTGGGGAIDEERRLCYVGMTRAQERLTMTLALARRKRGRLKDTHASRFLFEMTGKVPASAKNA